MQISKEFAEKASKISFAATMFAAATLPVTFGAEFAEYNPETARMATDICLNGAKDSASMASAEYMEFQAKRAVLCILTPGMMLSLSNQ